VNRELQVVGMQLLAVGKGPQEAGKQEHKVADMQGHRVQVVVDMGVGMVLLAARRVGHKGQRVVEVDMEEHHNRHRLVLLRHLWKEGKHGNIIHTFQFFFKMYVYVTHS